MVPGSRMLLVLSAVHIVIMRVECLDNGLARTPPMGWLTWTRFLCNVDIINDFDNAITGRLLMDMADRMVDDGFKDAGYEYIIVDDCWSYFTRDSDGKLMPHPHRFPRGMKYVADYIHSKGLKFGIYADVGSKTCAGYPGSLDNYTLDAQTFAEWGVDYVKVDGCNVDPAKMDKLYPEFGRAILATGRPMVYSCEWPLYQLGVGIEPNYTSIAATCNLWRNYADITYAWERIYSAVEFEARHQDILFNVSGPGAWTDPDMLVIGNFGLDVALQRTHMAYWAIMASPLIMSNDLRRISEESKAILMNKNVIAVNQDKLGIMGRRISKVKGIDMWSRWIGPTLPNGKASMAVVVHNTNLQGGPMKTIIFISALGLDNPRGYVLTDLFNNNATIGLFYPGQNLTVAVPPMDVLMFKATITDR